MIWCIKKQGESCANLFYKRKHKRVGLIGFPTKGKSADLVEMAFIKSCKDKNILIDSNYIFYCEERNFNSGYGCTWGY